MSVNTESSLTNPKDRDTKNKWKPDTLSDPLTREQTIEAAKELNITSFVEKFPRIDRTYADPPVNLQNYGLISFIPAKGSTPNEDGIYGFAKLRGNFNSEMESSQRAETIIKTVDSFHKIYTTYVNDVNTRVCILTFSLRNRVHCSFSMLTKLDRSTAISICCLSQISAWSD